MSNRFQMLVEATGIQMFQTVLQYCTQRSGGGSTRSIASVPSMLSQTATAGGPGGSGNDGGAVREDGVSDRRGRDSGRVPPPRVKSTTRGVKKAGRGESGSGDDDVQLDSLGDDNGGVDKASFEWPPRHH